MKTFPSGIGARQIHPRMQAHLRSLKLTQAVIYAAVFVMIGLMTTFTMTRPGGADMLRPMLPALALVILACIILARVLRNTLSKKALAANDLMLRTTPKTMLLRPTGVNTLQGIMVELHKPGAGENAPPFGLAALQTSRRTPVPGRPQDVEVYLEQYGHPPMVVVDTGKYLYWGRLTDLQERGKIWGYMRLMQAGILGILMLLVVILGVLQYSLLQDVEAERTLAVDSADWPVVKGTVLRSRVAETTISKGKSRVQAFEAMVEYGYSVDGQSFRGDLVQFCYRPSQKRSLAEELVARYPPGAPVAVSHHPAAPGLAVLEAGHTDGCMGHIAEIKQTLLLTGAMTAGVIAILLVVFRIENNRRQKLAARLERYGIRL